MSYQNSTVTDHRRFLTVLKNSWPTDETLFTEENDLFFNNHLYSFCNNRNDYTLSAGDFKLIYDFINESLFKLISLGFSERKVTPYIKDRISSILVLIKYLAIHYNIKVMTQTFFMELFNSILSFPVSNDDPEQIYFIMECYDCTDLLYVVSHQMVLMNLTDVPEETLSGFMKKARSTKQTRLFRFYLYPFNNRYFRCNYPCFPDECDARELYFGIYFGYFKLTYGSEVYKTLYRMCEEVSDDLVSKKNHMNPIYNFYLFSQSDGQVKLFDIYSPLERLFRD